MMAANMYKRGRDGNGFMMAEFHDDVNLSFHGIGDRYIGYGGVISDDVGDA